MLQKLTVLAIVWFGLLRIAGATAAETSEILSEYSMRQWGVEDGLTDDGVRGIDQRCPDGYLWCMSHGYIARFDGLRFTAVPCPQSGSASPDWKGVSVDHLGAPWLFGPGGVRRYDGNSWESFPASETHGAVLWMDEDSNGVTWGACKGGLCRFDTPNPAFFPCVAGGMPAVIEDMAIALDGRVWLVARNSKGIWLLRFQNGVYLGERLPSEYSGEQIRKLHAGAWGKIWVATEMHLLCWSDGEWRTVSCSESQLDCGDIRTLFERREGELWVGTVRGLFRLRQGKWSKLTTLNGIFPFSIRNIKEDHQGTIWLATAGGVVHLTPKMLTVCRSGAGAEKESYLCLLQSGSQWCAAIAGRGPMVGIPGDLRPAMPGLFPENVTASALTKGRDGSLWAGTYGRGLWRSLDGRGEEILTKPKADQSASGITALLEDRTGRLLVGTVGGLFAVVSGSLVPVQVWNGHPVDRVNVLYEDRNGTVWVGYQHLGLANIMQDGSSFHFEQGAGLPGNSVRAIYQDSAGVLWIGTSGGLARWDKHSRTLFTAAQGLVDENIRQIVEDDSGRLWLGTRHGIMRVNHLELSGAAPGVKAALSARLFGVEDGMASEECTGAAAVKSSDGKLWFPTSDGLVMADPSLLSKSADAPLVFVEEIREGGHRCWSFDPVAGSSAKSAPIRLSPRARDIEFHFTALDFSTPEQIRFKYRVEGTDEDWSTPNASRSALIHHLRPGSYRFRVLACDSGGTWSSSSTSASIVAFTVPPRFWQTWWFMAGEGVAALSMVAVGIGYWERRKARLKLRELEHAQTIERERARIARDIHDEIGAGLTEMALLSELAQADSNEPEKECLSQIFSTARELARSLEEIVWAINPANDTLEKLVSYLVEFARDFLGTAGIACRLDVPTNLPPITVTATVRHQICLAVKEALNNTVKHAGASEVRLKIQQEADKLLVMIEDNGCGFERDKLTDPATTRSGLANLESRMREIGGCLDQQSAIGKGTCVRLSVEIPTAPPSAKRRA